MAKNRHSYMPQYRLEESECPAGENTFCTSRTPYEVTAFHEASHAVAAIKLGVPFHYTFMSVYQCTARPGDIVGGLYLTPEFAELDTKDPENADDRKKIENLAVVVIAGEAGQALMEQRNCDLRLQSAEGDYERVIELARWLYSDPVDRDAFIKRQTVAACALVSDSICYRQIECVADQLRLLLELTYDDVLRWMNFIDSYVISAESKK